MDFSRLATQQKYADFQHEVSAFLDAELTAEVLAEAAASRDEHHPGFFRALGRRGWIIPGIPVADGGAGLDYREIEILDSELDARYAPTLNVGTTRMIYPSIAGFGSEQLKAEALPGVLAGETALTLGYTEPDGGSDIAAAKTRARRDPGGGWVITGAKAFTTGAHHSKWIFLLATSNPEAKKGLGLTMFLVPLDLPGISVEPIWTLSERTNLVTFSDVAVPDRYRLGEVDQGWAVLQGPLAMEHSLHATSEKGNGDIATFHIRHLAQTLDAALDWLTATEAGRARADHPLTALRIGEVAGLVATGSATFGLTGRVAASDSYVAGVEILTDLIAPAALLPGELAAGLVESLSRRAPVSATYGGTVEVFKNLITKDLGLPRQAYSNS